MKQCKKQQVNLGVSGIRAKFESGKPWLGIGFYDKGKGKSQIAVDHEKLLSKKEVEEKREFWKKVLGELF